MRSFRLSSLLIFFTSVMLLSQTVSAQTDTESTVMLSEKLNELKMFDLSFYLLETEMAANPDNKDKLMVQKAQTHFSKGEISEGEAILKNIPPGPAKNYANLILGIKFVNEGANDKAVKPLESYFAFMTKYMKDNKPPRRTKSLEKEYLKAVAYLRHAYTKLAKPTEAVKVMEYIKKFQKWVTPEGEGGGDTNKQQDQYEQILLSAQAKLDAAESMIAEGKKGWEPIVNSVLKPLESIYWSGATSWTAMACVERTRALCLLGRYEDALKELAKYIGLIKNLDEGYKKEGMLYAAPSAKAYLWKGKTYLGLAKKAGKDEDKIKLNYNAAKSFLRVIIKYDMDKCPHTNKAFAGFNTAKEELAKLGKVIKLPANIKQKGGGDNFKFKRKSADDMFNRKKYAEAIPLYLKLIRSPGGRNSKDTPDFLYRLAVCYMNTGGVLEAMSLAGYLGDTFPNDKEYTPVTLLLVGEHFWKQYKKPGPLTPAKKEALEDSLRVYEVYAKNCPTHEYAASIAMRVAKVYYDRASKMALDASKMKNGPEKQKETDDAREAFKKAIPYYQYIVDNYGPTNNGKMAAYLVAWCYTNSRQYVKGAELFKKYADLETDWEKPEERKMGQVAKAKYHAAENYLQEGIMYEKEAKALLKKAEDAPKGSTLSAEAPKAEGEAKPEAAPKTAATEKNAEEKQEKTAKKPEAEEAPAKPAKEPETEPEFLAAAAAQEKIAKGYYQKSVANLNELLDKWMQAGGRLVGVKGSKDKKQITDITGKAMDLLGWAYDSAGDKEKAIKAFTDFIGKYEKDNEFQKSIPKAMLRLGMLYLEMDKPNEAGQVLTTLSAKYPEEGKLALPKLARTMYDIKKYDKSIDAVKKIFETDKMDVAVPDLRWIAKNMSDCGGSHPKEGAELAQKACIKLQELIKKPLLADWLGKQRAKQIEKDPKAIKKNVAILKENLLYMSAEASYWADNFQGTVDTLTILLENEQTPYFWDAYFLRGAAYMSLGKPQKALDDYGKISMALLGVKNGKDSLYFKVQCKIGDAYIAMKEYGKAAGAYNNAAMSVMDTGGAGDAIPGAGADAPKKEVDPAEKKAQQMWVEYAVFMVAVCQNELGKKEDAQVMQDLYKKKFAQGKFKDQINNLPKPDEAVKLFNEK